jgi:hypothetical protein
MRKYRFIAGVICITIAIFILVPYAKTITTIQAITLAVVGISMIVVSKIKE